MGRTKDGWQHSAACRDKDPEPAVRMRPTARAAKPSSRPPGTPSAPPPKQMARIRIVPEWAKLIDFETTLPVAVERLVAQRKS